LRIHPIKSCRGSDVDSVDYDKSAYSLSLHFLSGAQILVRDFPK
jgi:hypothetical protein